MPAFAQKQRWWEFLSFDRVILLVIVTLMALGLLNLRNADFYSADSFHERQLKWYLLGTVVALMVSAIDLHIVSRLSYVAYGLCIIALIAVLFTDPINNSRRWLSIPGMQQAVQPSEFVKLAVVLALSRWYHDQRHRGSDGPTHWLRRLIRPLTPFLLIVAPVILIFWEPDLGTALIVLLIGLSVIFFEGVRWRSIFMAISVVALVFPLAWKFALHDYQKARVMVWWDAESLKERVEQLESMGDDAASTVQAERLSRILDKAYQPQKAVEAIGSGEFHGKGGQQGHATRQSHLPELHTDFVIATWGEERGFIGCSILLTLYYLLVYWAIRVAARFARDTFQVLMAAGLSATIFWQFFVNVGMVTGVLPVVGVALPLLSYGGSSVLSICIAIGLLFNVVRRGRATG